MTYDLALSQQQRDRALARVHREEFFRNASEHIVSLSYHLGGTFSAEELRHRCEECGITPHHPNAWGHLIRSLIRRRILAPTGKWVKMRNVRSHARLTPEYRFRPRTTINGDTLPPNPDAGIIDHIMRTQWGPHYEKKDTVRELRRQWEYRLKIIRDAGYTLTQGETP